MNSETSICHAEWTAGHEKSGFPGCVAGQGAAGRSKRSLAASPPDLATDIAGETPDPLSSGETTATDPVPEERFLKAAALATLPGEA